MNAYEELIAAVESKKINILVNRLNYLSKKIKNREKNYKKKRYSNWLDVKKFRVEFDVAGDKSLFFRIYSNDELIFLTLLEDLTKFELDFKKKKGFIFTQVYIDSKTKKK